MSYDSPIFILVEGTNVKKTVIISLFITSLVLANVVTGKILDIYGLIIPGAVLLYAITFLMTDLMNELYGKKEAQRLVVVGFIVSVFASVMIYLTSLLPAAVFAEDVSKAYDILLGMNMRFVIASMIAYYLSQTWDVWVFDKLRTRSNGKHKWLRNNASTMTSQLIDTAIFITIAFWGVVPNLWVMIVSQYVVRLIIAAVDTPFFYWFTRKSEEV